MKKRIPNLFVTVCVLLAFVLSGCGGVQRPFAGIQTADIRSVTVEGNYFAPLELTAEEIEVLAAGMGKMVVPKKPEGEAPELSGVTCSFAVRFADGSQIVLTTDGAVLCIDQWYYTERQDSFADLRALAEKIIRQQR